MMRLRYGCLAALLLSSPLHAQDTSPLIVSIGAQDAGKDWQKDLQHTFDLAAAGSRKVQLAPGVFLHSGTLTLNGVQLSGAGNATVLQGTERNNNALILTGDGAGVNNLKLSFPSTTRSSYDESALVLVRDATHFTVSSLILDNSDSVGVFVLRSSGGVIENNTVSNTLADSIHMTGGSSDILVKGNTTHFSGDDGIAVVSYEKNPKKVAHIEITGNSILYNKAARGISVVGGEDVNIHDNTIACDQGVAGIYIASEPSYKTYGANNIKVAGNTVKGCGGLRTGHGAIMIYTGYLPNNGIAVMNNIITDSPGSGIAIRGWGNQGISLISNTITHSGGEPITEDGQSAPAERMGNTIQ